VTGVSNSATSRKRFSIHLLQNNNTHYRIASAAVLSGSGNTAQTGDFAAIVSGVGNFAQGAHSVVVSGKNDIFVVSEHSMCR
jgi:hypothetical protein